MFTKQRKNLLFPVRRANGNMLAFVAGTFCALVVFFLFALSYVRLLGSNGEQKTAIEAASLAAATDVSRIVVLDPNFGYVSFSDVAPIGTATTAGDNFYMPVSSINSLMGTIRLDLTIANALQNKTMKALALRDLANLKTAKDNLIAAINTSIKPGGSGQDANGNTIKPYDDALAAYNQNRIRMTGASSYVQGSLALSMGSVAGGETNIPIPQPDTFTNLTSTQQVNGFYRPNIAVPTADGTNFVFASLGNAVRLVDNRIFQTKIAGLPFDMPSIIKAEAQQSLSDNGTQRVVHCAACAQPSNVFDPRPAPGALSINFPDGVPPEIGKPGDLLGAPFDSGTPVVGQTPSGGDYPPDSGSTLGPITWTPGGGGSPDPAGSISTGTYDWMRRAGPKLKVDAIVAMQSTPFVSSGNSADNILTTNLYTVDANGNVVYSARKLSDPNIAPGNVGSYNPPAPDPISVVSDKQLFTTSLDALKSADLFSYDAYVRDCGYRPGISNGGKHGGEPLTNSVLTQIANHVCSANMVIASADLEPIKLASGGTSGSGSAYDCGGSGDGAHWGIPVGGPGVPIAQLNITTPPDGHLITFYIYANAVLTRNDFGLPSPSPVSYFTFATGPAGGTTRPTYLQNGLVSEIRLRRAVPLAKAGLPGKGYGSFGTRKYPPPPPYPISPSYNLP